ncbi:MAG: hypothetical protein RIC35_17545 [Marinoscillum sp.]
MKSNILYFLITILSSIATAQQVTYQVLEDEPKKAYTKFIAPELGTEYNSTTLSVFVGANGRYGLTNALTLEGAARIDVYNLNGPGPGLLFEGGAFLPLTSKIKNKEVPIILSYNPYAGTTYKDGKSYNVEETKSITIPNGQYYNQMGVRGGLHYRKTGSTDLTYTTESPINLMGIYLGGQFTTQAYVKTKINNEVERIGAGFTRVYVDALILPVTEIKDPAANDGLKDDGAIGWRVGFQWYLSPHDGEYKFLGSSVFTAEIGSRPLSGFLFNLSWGFALLNSR